MHRASSSQYCSASGSKGNANETVSGDLKRRFSIWRDFHDTALSREGSGHIQVSIDVEGQSLGTSQAAIESGDVAVRINFVHAIEA